MKNIPLFPLNIVALPKEKIPLHIFEPRYKRMIKNSINSGEPFGIIHQDQDGFKSIGCSVKIVNVIKEYSSGEFDIIVEGQQCFQIETKVQEDDNLWIGTVSFLKDQHQINEDLLDKIRDQYLHIIMKLGINEDMERHINKKNSFDFIEFVNLPNKIKQELLEEDDENKRLQIINRIFTAVMSISNFGSNGQQISEA
ncbi:MAG: LON peptidase substrate-binding domain-containing protein [Candidatus Neomarinimicrobiota bacterium]|nr:LON peptidase substrate-binding domain-containing protein [Candidatus Neomarinimicrobiota bacterium]|tara:strand:- start:188 stop:778 length:591 start_codon:yes stop_codon:yes gene_type:complete